MSKFDLTKRAILSFFFAGTLMMTLVMMNSGAALKTSATPKGIVDLEFANNAEKALVVINAWTGKNYEDTINKAKNNTLFDFIFLFFYAGFLYYSCKLIAGSYNGFLFKTGRLIAGGAIAAGVLDVFENIGMLLTLNGHVSNDTTLMTFVFSIAKWILVLAAVLYLLVGGLFLLYRQKS
ncbi:MAG: hypothetical protein ABIN01_16445 [Ferruginibacter sp.]